MKPSFIVHAAGSTTNVAFGPNNIPFDGDVEALMVTNFMEGNKGMKLVKQLRQGYLDVSDRSRLTRAQHDELHDGWHKAISTFIQNYSSGVGNKIQYIDIRRNSGRCGRLAPCECMIANIFFGFEAFGLTFQNSYDYNWMSFYAGDPMQDNSFAIHHMENWMRKHYECVLEEFRIMQGTPGKESWQAFSKRQASVLVGHKREWTEA